MPSAVDLVKQQLDLERTAFKYFYGPQKIDELMAGKLAKYLVSIGVHDIRDVALWDAPVQIKKDFGNDMQGKPILGVEMVESRFLYNARTGKPLPAPKIPKGWPMLMDSSKLLVYVDGYDQYRVYFLARFTPDGVVYFVPDVKIEGTSGVFSSWFEAMAPVLPIVAIAFAVLVPGLGAAIGQAIMPASLAAAAPALVPAIGNVALSTAFNGGNIEAAVIGALSGGLGNFAGGTIASATESALIGKLAGVATSAALKGGDIKQAIAGSLLAQGASTVAQLADSWASEPEPDFGESWKDFDWSEPVDPSFDFTDAAIDFDADNWFFDEGWFDTSTFDPSGMDRPTTGISTPAVTPAPAPVSSSSSGGSGLVVTITNAALAAIKINQAYQASKQPQPRTSTVASNTVKTGNPNGTLTVRNTQTGASAIARPEVGVPYTLANGSTIINNGNGTFDTIRADGSRTTTAYAATSSSSSGMPAWMTPGVLAAGAGVVGLLLLSRR